MSTSSGATFAFAAALGAVLGCSGSIEPSAGPRPEPGSPSENVGPGPAMPGTVPGGVTPGPLATDGARGAAPHILTGAEVCSHFQNVFGAAIVGQTSRASACFAPAEDAVLGTFSTRDNGFAPFMDVLEGVDQDYLLVVWRFLARTCAALVAAELKAPGNPANKLVEGAVPSQSKVNAFMSSMFGYDPGGGRLHAGAREYAELFASHIKAAATPAASTQDYLLLCVSIGSDLRTLVR